MDEFLNIAICEDTKEDEEKLLSILEKIELRNRCTIFHSAKELLDVYHPQEFDLLLLDIYMEGMTGVEALTKIREIDEDIPVAFITISKDHALESYRLSALKYIEKPYQKKAIEDILKLAQMEKENAPSLVVHQNGKEQRIRLSQLVYLEAQGRQVNIYLKSGETVSVYEKLSALAPQLTEQPFFSPHKSYCINLGQVQYIDTELKCFFMTNSKNVPIRRETMGKAKQVLKEFLFSQTRGISR